jgi:DNA-binding response OmpR family regulator
MPRILLAEPDATLAEYLRAHLEAEGHAVEQVHGGRALLARLQPPGGHAPAVDLAAFALQLPDLHGFQVVRELREAGAPVAVVVTSACDEEAHRVRGLRLGADDFLVKPFGVTEFLARVDAVLRRTLRTGTPAGAAAVQDLPPAAPGRWHFGEVEVDAVAQVVRRRGREVALAPKEFELLLALLRHGGGVATRASLLGEVWGYDRSVTSRTVDSHVAALRRKLEADPRAPRHLVTVYKTGYRLRP